jgi:hypothetical protein
MNPVEKNDDQTAPESRTEQEHRSKQHDHLGWARKYLDLADQAMTNNSSEASDQR